MISVRDISKLNKYVYVERNINDNINRQLQFTITMEIVIRVFENIQQERDGIYRNEGKYVNKI